jgi:hypothetical protein
VGYSASTARLLPCFRALSLSSSSSFDDAWAAVQQAERHQHRLVPLDVGEALELVRRELYRIWASSAFVAAVHRRRLHSRRPPALLPHLPTNVRPPVQVLASFFPILFVSFRLLQPSTFLTSTLLSFGPGPSTPYCTKSAKKISTGRRPSESGRQRIFGQAGQHFANISAQISQLPSPNINISGQSGLSMVCQPDMRQ